MGAKRPKSLVFKILQKLKTIKHKFLKFASFIIIPWGHTEVPHKIWTRSVQPFCRLLDTNKQTDTHAKFVYRWKY